MPHLVRKRWNQLKEGDEIKLKGDDRTWEIIEKTGGANFVVETPLDEIDENGQVMETKEVTYGQDYEYSWMLSEDCEAAAQSFQQSFSHRSVLVFTQGWTEAERHYGIGHLGSGQTDPIRQLALAILRGDPMACDAARDIFKC